MLILLLCLSQGFGIRPQVCSAIYAWYTNMMISLVLIVAVFVSYWTLSSTLKKHFYSQYELHRNRLAGLTIGMELALITYFSFVFMPVFGPLQMIINQ